MFSSPLGLYQVLQAKTKPFPIPNCCERFPFIVTLHDRARSLESHCALYAGAGTQHKVYPSWHAWGLLGEQVWHAWSLLGALGSCCTHLPWGMEPAHGAGIQLWSMGWSAWEQGT